MDKKKLFSLIKKVIDKNSVLPILENVLIDSGYLEVSDLEVSVSIPLPYYKKVSAVIPYDKFITAMELMETPTIVNTITGSIEAKNWHSAVVISEGKKIIKLAGEMVDNFPLAIKEDHFPLNHIGTIGVDELRSLEIALQFTSDDDLSQAMKGVHISKNIAATNAHQLYWKPLAQEFMEEVILPQKAIRVLLELDTTFEAYSNGVYICFVTADGVSVYSRIIDARFPNYEVVIPEGDGTTLLTAEISELRSEIKNAIKFANKSTSKVVFDMDAEIKLSAQDIDLDHEYITTLEKAEVTKNKNMSIAFNGKLLDEILAMQDKKKPVSFKLWHKDEAAIINDHFLIMPLMNANQ